jgi:hypothetical protein
MDFNSEQNSAFTEQYGVLDFDYEFDFSMFTTDTKPEFLDSVLTTETTSVIHNVLTTDNTTVNNTVLTTVRSPQGPRSSKSPTSRQFCRRTIIMDYYHVSMTSSRL